MAPRFSIVLLLSLFSICAVDCAHRSVTAPAPSADCSSLVMNMVDCLSFVSSGSTVSKPEGTCCSGLKTVLATDAECLCEGFKSSASLGVTLNVTKALTLPAACKINAPSVANCGLSLTPAGAPGVSPTSGAGVPTSPGANEQAPAPAPASSSSSVLTISVWSLVIGIAVAGLSSGF